MAACVDLFCSAGGLTHGLSQAGVKVVAGIDIDPACAYPYGRLIGNAVPVDLGRVIGQSIITHLEKV